MGAAAAASAIPTDLAVAVTAIVVLAVVDFLPPAIGGIIVAIVWAPTHRPQHRREQQLPLPLQTTVSHHTAMPVWLIGEKIVL